MKKRHRKSFVFFVPLALLAGSGCGTPAQPGTPMNSTCRELPTVEECREAANVIEDERLWEPRESGRSFQ